jgi:hypothetical protein
MCSLPEYENRSPVCLFLDGEVRLVLVILDKVPHGKSDSEIISDIYECNYDKYTSVCRLSLAPMYCDAQLGGVHTTACGQCIT